MSDMQGSPPRQHPPADHNAIPDFNDADDCRNEPEHIHNEPLEHHPHSQLPSTIHRFAEFSRSRPTEEHTPRNNSPWEPFRMRLDFEVAEIALEAVMTKDQTNRLLDLFHRSATGNDSFTLHNHDEVCSLWDFASQRYTRHDTLSVPFEKEVYEFDMHYRPLFDWALDLLRDERLAPHFPWTADAFWNAQSQLPPDAKPLAFILYADKSKLLSFGTQKGYPIIARIANLPVHIRNGNTALGGGRVVGWLLIVVEDQKHMKKKKYVDFKNAVWHTSFYQLLASVEKHSKTGYWFECAGGIQCCLWPLILILSADYEEQCIMALIRGLKGKFPCPVCLVPQDEQSILHTHELHTCHQSKDVLRLARSMPSEKEKEDHLKAFSLRDVDNVFSKILYTDVHRALSVDRLHTNKEGLWGDHLWKEVKYWISDLGQEASVKLDENFDALPRWPNMTHFLSVIAVDFTDGTVLGHLSKMIIFAAQDILTSSHCKLGHLLLCCVCYYVELDIYTSLEVHTEDTIAAGKLALQKFSEIMGEYITQSQPETFKNWNFPKKHLISHVFDDILAKGVTRNYNTKPNEKMHGALRKIYLQRTNFKNVASQINAELDETVTITDAHSSLGSKQGNHCFSDITRMYRTDRAFTDFRMKLNSFLNVFLPQNHIPLPDERRIHLCAEDMITEFRFLRVNYESIVDWRVHRDLLQCNPKFYGSPRYDCVMVKTVDKPFFARLVYMFTCSIGGTDFPLALIHPYDVNIAGTRRRRDDDIGLWRIISVQSIIRGAALANDPETAGDYFVIHTVDTDIFLRVKALQAQSV
ncbi:uncharacterized protein F5891DRAFT_1126021 [Suillus fuscotomentosus]|uniref:Uncharacterized protein n=1 Tax=Suillus fuscotomentosus TaxID=1912939 RepID=A0AAD4EHM3_9AGAM|nr:uncharacterized protein F5891DRAFT_1126021 [Suillus fuscotomentosus]KAG1905179.1 hypothetical protein F5891DRAFT_1126021 [Suillus fuscotomentosus]